MLQRYERCAPGAWNDLASWDRRWQNWQTVAASTTLRPGRRPTSCCSGCRRPSSPTSPAPSCATAAWWPRSGRNGCSTSAVGPAPSCWTCSTRSITRPAMPSPTDSAERATYYTERKDAELAGSTWNTRRGNARAMSSSPRWSSGSRSSIGSLRSATRRQRTGFPATEPPDATVTIVEFSD